MLKTLSVAAAFVLAGSVLAIWLAGRTVRPVRELTDVASRLAAGDLDVRAPAGGDDEIGVQPPLEREVGHAEGPVLVGPEAIADVVGALADPPGHRVARSIGHLAPDRSPVGLVEVRLR